MHTSEWERDQTKLEQKKMFVYEKKIGTDDINKTSVS